MLIKLNCSPISANLELANCYNVNCQPPIKILVENDITPRPLFDCKKWNNKLVASTKLITSNVHTENRVHAIVPN